MQRILFRKLTLGLTASIPIMSVEPIINPGFPLAGLGR